MYTKRKQSLNSLLEKLEGSWYRVEVAGGDPGQGEKGTLTVTVPFFLNCNKQEAAAGAGSQKESYTLERIRELRNIFPDSHLPMTEDCSTGAIGFRKKLGVEGSNLRWEVC